MFENLLGRNPVLEVLQSYHWGAAFPSAIPSTTTSYLDGEGEEPMIVIVSGFWQEKMMFFTIAKIAKKKLKQSTVFSKL